MRAIREEALPESEANVPVPSGLGLWLQSSEAAVVLPMFGLTSRVAEGWLNAFATRRPAVTGLAQCGAAVASRGCRPACDRKSSPSRAAPVQENHRDGSEAKALVARTAAAREWA